MDERELNQLSNLECDRGDIIGNQFILPGRTPSVGVNAAWVGIAAITLFRDWWKGPAEAYKKVTSHFSKRHNMRKITLQRIKLPVIKHSQLSQKKGRQDLNRQGQPQLS